MDIKIFLTNLGKYNEGELVGEWIDLPVDDDFEQAFEDIGISDEPDENGNYYEEYFITDYEAPFSIGEYDDIYELNELAEELEDLDVDEDIFEAISQECSDEREALDIVANGDYYVYNCDSMEDVARELFGDSINNISNPENYFDYESFGRDLDLSGFFTELAEGDEDAEEFYDNMSDYDKGQYYVYDILGDISELSTDEIERYFDWSDFGRDLYMEGTFIEYPDGYIELP